MKKIVEILSEKLKAGFAACGYDEKYAMVTVSNRPDLCEYQCNGAMAAAKAYKKAPISIATEVVEKLSGDSAFAKIDALAPGFINITLDTEFVLNYVAEMEKSKAFGYEMPEKQTIVIDYGGPNVAKPLHIGHLRSAIIGEAVKRMLVFEGHNVIGDAHLGDWGLQIGLIIRELKERHPDWVYFDESFEGEYPEESPFDMAELEVVYPYASAYSKEHPDYLEEARTIVYELQQNKKPYYALWKHIMEVSVADEKVIYDRLNVHFDVWKKESDVAPLIDGMVKYLKDNGYATISEGALVVEVKEEGDTKEYPPCMILKANGATLYDSTDVATILEREQLFNPDEIIYLTDKRQALHFEIVFRCVKKAKIAKESTRLIHIGFGTMNGKDGKPFKTREGGVMRLERLLDETNEKVYEKIIENRDMEPEEARKIAEIVGLSALKYGDLSNQAGKDYNFDLDRFVSFEGETGPYILYTMVRIKSILQKCAEFIAADEGRISVAASNKTARTDSEKALLLTVARFNDSVASAIKERAPHRLCAYVYELAYGFNKFYHENIIATEENEELKSAWLGLLKLTLSILETCTEMLGFSAPDRM